MDVEVDQSAKIEQTDKDTVLALSNDISYAIRIPARVKREAIAWLRFKGLRGRRLYMLLFAAALHMLLREQLDRVERVILDVEYEGHERDIKLILLDLLWRDLGVWPADKITFGHIGKRSPAHKKALAVYRGNVEADRVVTVSELLGPLENKKITGEALSS